MDREIEESLNQLNQLPDEDTLQKRWRERIVERFFSQNRKNIKKRRKLFTNKNGSDIKNLCVIKINKIGNNCRSGYSDSLSVLSSLSSFQIGRLSSTTFQENRNFERRENFNHGTKQGKGGVERRERRERERRERERSRFEFPLDQPKLMNWIGS